jgi:hypothetical protein
LPEPTRFNKKEITHSLEIYQEIMNGEINYLLESNHRMGLAMDIFDKKSKAAEIKKYIELEKNHEKGITYRMNSAGYGVNP